MKRHQDRGWTGRTSATHGPRTCYRYRAGAVDDPPNRPAAEHCGPAGRRPSANSFHTGDEELFDPDGRPSDTEEDLELSRTLKELRQLEQRMRCKEATRACKTVLEPPSAAADEGSGRGALRERVNAILQRRQSSGFLSKVSRGSLFLIGS